MGSMVFDPENKVVKLCAPGMAAEGTGQRLKAASFFIEAWHIADTHFEKFTAAHFVARHQPTVHEKLNWDQIALENALLIQEQHIRSSLPSLYLNIGKCHEDLGDLQQAKENYEEANAHLAFLAEDGYGIMIRSGIVAALKRTE